MWLLLIFRYVSLVRFFRKWILLVEFNLGRWVRVKVVSLFSLGNYEIRELRVILRFERFKI